MSQYITQPGISLLQRMSDDELAEVSNFMVIRDGYGEIKWEGKTDVRGLDLDELVVIERKVRCLSDTLQHLYADADVLDISTHL